MITQLDNKMSVNWYIALINTTEYMYVKCESTRFNDERINSLLIKLIAWVSESTFISENESKTDQCQLLT